MFLNPELEVEPEPEPDPVVLEKHEYHLYEGYTIIGFPVRPFDDEYGDYNSEVEDFYHIADIFDSSTEGIFFHFNVDGVFQQWYFYNGIGLLGNIPAARNYGVVVKLDESETIEIEGVANVGHLSHQINVGTNVIGLPVIPSLYKRPSDFISIDGIDVVIGTNEDGFYAVGREGDTGDDLFYEGQGIILLSTVEMRLDLSSSVVAAPQASRVGTLTMTWGGIKTQ